MDDLDEKWESFKLKVRNSTIYLNIVFPFLCSKMETVNIRPSLKLLSIQ